MYNLIKYSNNYSDISRNLLQFKRDEQNMSNGNPANFATDDSSSFRYKSTFIKESTAGNNNNNNNNIAYKDVKIAVLLKYLSSFLKSLEMPLINCKIHLELN